jgi:hypothetical protein
VFLALAGGAEPLDLPGAPLDDEVVLDAVALLLAAVELSLPLGILGALDGALHSVDDELESLAFAQHRLEVAGLAGWELLLVTERRIEERGQTVNPLVGLRLAHPEEQTLHRLDGVEPEIDQDEHESVCGPPGPPCGLRPRRRRRPASRRSRSASQAPSKDGRICLKPSVLRPVSVLNMRRWRASLA